MAEPRPQRLTVSSRRPDPRCLDEDETSAWLAFASVLLTLPSALDAQLQRDASLTFYEYLVLAALSSVKGPRPAAAGPGRRHRKIEEAAPGHVGTVRRLVFDPLSPVLPDR